MEIREANAFGVEPVEVRRFDEGIALAAQVAVALVVGQDQDHVGTVLREDPAGRQEEQSEDQVAYSHLSATFERDPTEAPIHFSTFLEKQTHALREGGHSCPPVGVGVGKPPLLFSQDFAGPGPVGELLFHS